MELLAQSLGAALLAGLLSYCDLDSVFDIPPTVQGSEKWKLLSWWWGFVAGNAIFAGGVFLIIQDGNLMPQSHPWVNVLIVGAGYSAVIRMKFTTISIGGKETPIGIDTFHQALKNVVLKRINSVVKEWRMIRLRELMGLSLEVLTKEAKLSVSADALKNEHRKQHDQKWIEDLLKNKAFQEDDKRRLLAVLIVTGETS